MIAATAGAELADLEFCQFHPTALALPGTEFDGVLITEAVRGEGATLLDAAGRRFTDELAPRDAVTAAILERIEADGSPERPPRPPRDRSLALPERLPLACRGRPLAGDRARSGRAGRPLHDGRDRDRPRRPFLAARAVRRRRVLVHRPPRRQPAGLELAQRVLRLRWPRRPGRRGRELRRRAPADPRSPLRTARRRRTRDAVWELAGPMRRPELLRRAARPTPTRSRSRSRPPRSSARSRAAATCEPTSPTSTRRSTASTSSSAPTARPVARPGSEGLIACCSGSTSAEPSPTRSWSTASGSGPRRSRPRPRTNRSG